MKSAKNIGSAPDLDNTPPPVAGTAQSLAVVRRPNNIQDRLASDFMKQFDEVHAGGALPNLFPDDVRKGDYEIVRFIGFELVRDLQKKKGQQTFMSLKFEVLDETTGKVLHKAQNGCNTVLMDYFGVTTIDKGPEEGEIDDSPVAQKKWRDPKATPLLSITFAGQGNAKSGWTAPKLYIVAELIPKGPPNVQKEGKKK